MDLQRLLKCQLLDLCEELGVDANTSMKKPELVKAIQDEKLDNEEIEEMWEKIKTKKGDEAKFKELELEKLRLEVELRKTSGGRETEVEGTRSLYDMTKLIQAFKVGQDMGLYLVNFERACERARFNRVSWARRLLSVLPCEAAGVIARLSADDSDDYDRVKSCLLKKYRLSAEAFRQKFRGVTKKSEASYAEFAYELRSYLVEWMKVAESYDDKEKMLETVALEQFYKTLPESMRTWIQGKSGVDSVYRAADLADEYSSRRGGKEGMRRTFEKESGDERKKGGWKRTESRKEEDKEENISTTSRGNGPDSQQNKKPFEARRPIGCFNCHETGHIAAGCQKPKVVFALASKCEENEELLSPYLFDMTVNGKSCRVLRDSGATIDLIHPSYVTETHYNGKCSWIKSVLDEGSVWLPVADVLISGPFGELTELDELILPPTSGNFEKLVSVTKEVLIKEKKADPSLGKVWETSKEGVARKNVSFPVRDGVLYRHYRDRSGRTFDQLVVPEKYRADVLRLCHGAGWSGHLGNKKTKDRLLTEFYWPGCFRDAESQVRACDVCQRVGKPNEKCKAPLRLVPIISEPFRRVVIDVVGPLPATKAGYHYALTVMCAATKFPEAVPMKEQSSVEVVNALLSIFARVGFPQEVQSDQGSVFTSALTSGFLERCGIKAIHSSVYHPQSNSVERCHSVMKRVLRALTYESGNEWDACLPAMLFALRSVTHEATGFSPAELVYGRCLRTPLRLLRETWETKGSDLSVVQYILDLLERFRSTREVAEINMREAQSRAKRYYDRNARVREYRAGDQVLLLRPSRQNKLQVQWEGPCKVTQKLSDTNYAIETRGKRKEIRIYHCNLMKRYVSETEVVNLTLNAPEEVQTDVPLLWEAGAAPVGVNEVMAQAVRSEDLSVSERAELRDLLEKYENLFSMSPGRTSLATHDIELTSNVAVRSRPYRMSPRQQAILKDEVERMLHLGVNVPCESDYSSPMIIVEAAGRDPRPCIDYRKLNAITRDQAYPIPNVEERVETVSGARYVSTLDLVRGYWQVPMTERASHYAAFVTPTGTFRPLVLSFGLKNAPFCFSRMMDRILRGAESYALPYLDDIAIFSTTWADHMNHLSDVFERLRSAGLTAKPSKCQLARGEVRYLGHIVGQGLRRPDELKVEAVRDFPRPEKKTGIRAFLGLTGYYQRYIPQYSEKASPLTDALRKTEPDKIRWDDKKEQAFQGLKNSLCCSPILRAPDYSRSFIVQCDASNRGLGVILCQEDDAGEEHPVLYASRKLSGREEAYSASEKECAGLIWATQKLSCYLYGAPFIFVTDHCPLTWLTQMSTKNARLLRWSLALQELTFTVKYRRGAANSNVDGLSRSF
ncbi:uncharacterized protein ISCGN_008992 [Ixodes scapularis]